MEAAPLSTAELIEMGREMIQLVDARTGRAVVARRKIASLGQFPVVHGLARHSIRLAAVVLDLYEDDRRLEAMPSLRSSFELAITAQWVAQSSEAVFGFHAEEVRWRNALRDNMERASPFLSAEASSVARLHDEPIETHAGHPAKNFSQLCDQFGPIGRDLYVHYRMMSALTHPTAILADHYVVPDPESMAGAKLRMEPADIDHHSWLYFTNASILWSAGATEFMLTGKGTKVALAEFGRRLGSSALIPLSAEARRQDFETGRTRRQGEWKGRRPKKVSSPPFESA